MTAAIPIRTASFLGSPRISPADAGISFLQRSWSTLLPLRSGCVAAALHLDAEDGRGGHLLRRAKSDADLVGPYRPARTGLRYPITERVAEDEEVEYSGGGIGKGRKIGGGRGGDQSDNKNLADYYKQMLRSDPLNPLLLRNYGRFLHEVEGDAEGAEECYGRAILASPGDGEVLSLYGKLLWEAHGDEERAEAYFERAVEAAPDDCYVLGSYANFLWDTEEEEEEGRMDASPPLVEAF